LRSAFVVVQIALSIVLLCGAGLMLRSFFALTHVSVGFRPQSLLYAQLFFPRGRYDTPEQEKVFFSRLLPRVKAIPGVIAATEAITVPPLWYSQSEVTVPGTTHLEHWSALVELCSEDYFQTLDVAIVRGRLLSATDIDSARKVVVVNQTLARKFFGSEDPIGRKIKFNDFDQFPHAPHGAYFEIIGVVTDFRNSGLRNPTAPEAFLPYSNVGLGVGFVLAKTAVVPDAVLPSLRQEVWAVEPDAAVLRSGSLQSFLQENAYLEPRFDLFTTSAFAGMGLLLVIIGVFSVTAYAVSLQTHEFGIRMALGAQHGDVLAMVLRQGLMLIAGGAVIGVLASFALTRLLTRKVWGVSATDPWTFATVVTIVVSAGLAACLLPARRAMRVDPMIALRCE
jgi:putative ABC transport system permease protein